MLTAAGAVVLLAFLVSWALQRPWSSYIVAAAAVAPATAAVAVGTVGVPLFYFACLLFILDAAFRRRREIAMSKAQRLAFGLLSAFTVYAAIISTIGPLAFSGVAVFDPSRSVDSQYAQQAVLGFKSTNVVQLIYLTVTFLFVLSARRVRFPRAAIEFSLWLGIGLAALKGIAGGAWPTSFFQNMPGLVYPATDRNSGSFPEPSVLGGFAVVSLAYFASMMFTGGTGERFFRGAFGVIVASYVIFGAESGTAQLAVVVLAGLAGLVIAYRVRLRNVIPVRNFLTGLVVAVVGLTVLVSSGLALLSSIGEKGATDSFVYRNNADVRSMSLILETFGLGVGLGSNRPSSLIVMLLSSVGFIGSVLFLLAIASALVAVSHIDRAAAWGLAAAVIAGAVGIPDLTVPILWLIFAYSTTRELPAQPLGDPLRTRSSHGPAIGVSRA